MCIQLAYTPLNMHTIILYTEILQVYILHLRKSIFEFIEYINSC